MKFDHRGKVDVLPRWQRTRYIMEAPVSAVILETDALMKKTLEKWVIWPVQRA